MHMLFKFGAHKWDLQYCGIDMVTHARWSSFSYSHFAADPWIGIRATCELLPGSFPRFHHHGCVWAGHGSLGQPQSPGGWSWSRANENHPSKVESCFLVASAFLWTLGIELEQPIPVCFDAFLFSLPSVGLLHVSQASVVVFHLDSHKALFNLSTIVPICSCIHQQLGRSRGTVGAIIPCRQRTPVSIPDIS